jgi:hypothetical protein
MTWWIETWAMLQVIGTVGGVTISVLLIALFMWMDDK